MTGMRVCHRVFAPQLRSVAEQMFLAMHVPQRIVEVVAEILVDSDLCGHDSHGLPWGRSRRGKFGLQ